jgi:hypothetical protein
MKKVYDHIDFSITQGMREAAQRGLELRREQSKSQKGGLSTQEAAEHGVGSGVQRAVTILHSETLPPETWRRMHAFFTRFRPLISKARKVDARDKDAVLGSKMYVADLLWGGAPAETRAQKIVNQMIKADEDQTKTSSSENLIASLKFVSQCFEGCSDFEILHHYADGDVITCTCKITYPDEVQIKPLLRSAVRALRQAETIVAKVSEIIVGDPTCHVDVGVYQQPMTRTASEIPKTVKRYVQEHLDQGLEDSYAWALAWSRYCQYKNPESPHCKQDRYFRGK